MTKKILLCMLFVFSQAQAQDAKLRLGLEDVYQRALNQSEQLKISEKDIEIAQAQYRQLISAIYPSISLVGQQHYRSDKNYGSLSGGSIDEQTGSAGASSRRTLGYSQLENFVNLRQPLFNGFRDYILSDAMQAQQQALGFDLERKKELLYLDVAEIFHQIQMYQGDLKVLGESERVLETRIKELKDFISLGKSRESEVLSAGSDLAEVRSAAEQVKGLLLGSKELLSFLIGLPSSTWELNNPQAAEPLLPLDIYLQRAAERNDLKALQLRTSAAGNYVKASEREEWPSLSLDASASPFEDPERDRDWELVFRLEVPIYQGGRFAAQTAEERAKLESARLSEQQRSRQIERDVRVAYTNLTASANEQEKLQQLRDAARKNFISQKQDYSNGIVSNLEVLQAIRQLHDAERQVLDAETLVRLNKVRLEVQAGQFLTWQQASALPQKPAGAAQ